MFTNPYQFYPVGHKSTQLHNPYKKEYYNFKAKQRTYLVTLEYYQFDLVAIKYCDVKDKNAKNAYTKLFGDGDASRVIGTCFHIMHAVWKKQSNISFVFYASMRNVEQELFIEKKKFTDSVKKKRFVENYKRARYNIYRYGMLNFFSQDYFIPVSDKENCIYVLLNRMAKSQEQAMAGLQQYLKENYDLIFSEV